MSRLKCIAAAGGETGHLYAGYDKLLQERIFDPIGMSTATLSVEEVSDNPNHSLSHILDGDTVVVAESYDFTGDPLTPSGSIKASAMDMARYISVQVNQGIAPNGDRVVSEKNLSETWRPHIQENAGQSHYAMGWTVSNWDGVEVIYHEGAYDSFSSVLAFIPQAKTGLVVLTNLDAPDDFLEVMTSEFVSLVEN